MSRQITLRCEYREHATRHVSSNWATICDHHDGELPAIREFAPGSFNLTLLDPRKYVPPRDRELKDESRRRGQSGGNHISKFAKIVALDGKPVEAWIYRGGHPDNSIELLSKVRLRDFLGASNGVIVLVTIEEHEPVA